MFFNLLQPKKIYQSVFEIPFEDLQKSRIRGVIVDLDNTLTEWQNPELSQEAVDWLVKLREAGFQVCLVSNNSPRRVEEVAGKLGLPFVARAQKPRRKSFRRALEIMKTRPEETAVIGDQVFTDVLGGNRLGMYTILVPPISKKEFIGTRLVRIIERLVIERQNRGDS
ncbi:MAG: HAD-superfamily phosphatase subfamily IIIA [Thermoanaerobacterales bacterium 50_218]|nr:MAG: HAD-superfamily phosphatase subfamily IIIA [Thermoanaerobacterales bacterium 50_218]HAA89344.1 YqeG family HAD IIIA-type phosphatase [Peptococcaceae bacterium]